jgi:tetratricopeptide (TPR) repeat protein
MLDAESALPERSGRDAARVAKTVSVAIPAGDVDRQGVFLENEAWGADYTNGRSVRSTGARPHHAAVARKDEVVLASRAFALLAALAVFGAAGRAATADPSPAPAATPTPAAVETRDFAADIAAARELQRRGKSHDAIALLVSDHTLDPTNRDVTVALAQTYSYSGDQGDAISLLDRLLAASPDDADARILLAQAYAFNHDYAAAEVQYGMVLQSAPDDEDAQVGIGQTYTFEGKYADAKTIFQKILAHDPNNSDARVGLGGADAFSGDYVHARQAYQAVLDVQPDNADALVGLASVEYWLGNVPAAVALDNRALALDPGDSDATDLKKQLRVKTSPQMVATMTDAHSNDGNSSDYQLEERYYTQPSTSVGLVEELYQIGDQGVFVQSHRAGIVATYVGPNQFGADLRIVGSKFGGVPEVTDSNFSLFDTDGPWNSTLGTSTGGVDGSVEANGGRSAPGVQSALVRIDALFGDLGYTKRGSNLNFTAQTASYNDGNRFHEFTADLSHAFAIGAYDTITPDIGYRSAGFSDSYANAYVATNPGYYDYSAQRGVTLSVTGQRALTEHLSAGVVVAIGDNTTVIPTYSGCYPLYCAAGSFSTGGLPSEHFEPYFDYEGDRFSFVGAYYDDHYGGAGTGIDTVQPFAANTLDLTFSIRLP